MLGHTHSRLRASQDGFTMLELVVVMAIAGILMAVGMFGFWNWRQTAQQRGSASQLVSTLRNASERAISEGRTYCVDISPPSGSTATSYTLWRYSCSTASGTQVQGPFTVQSSKVSLATTNTLPVGANCPAGHKCLYFYPRGTAVASTVAVSSTARSRVYTVHVEGLTARVWM